MRVEGTKRPVVVSEDQEDRETDKRETEELPVKKETKEMFRTPMYYKVKVGCKKGRIHYNR